MTKSEIRTRAISRRDGIDAEDRRAFSQTICEALSDEEMFLDARAIHTYLPVGSEVDISPLLAVAWSLGKEVGMMVVDGDGGNSQLQITEATEYVRGPHGILQPVDSTEFDMERCDLVLVPIVAADAECNRIGYGKGYYDQFLTQYPRPSVGVAFEVQIFDELPVDSGDVRLDVVLTESNRFAQE